MADKNADSKTFRNVVLTLGTVLALFFLLAFVPKVISSFTNPSHTPQPGREWEGQIMTTMFAVFLFGFIVGWWRKLWGGILIILAGIIVSVPFIILRGNLGALIFGFPLFILGALYIRLNWIEKRENIKKEDIA
jgi:hypothetical protein